ncbi:Mannan endo-1,6-alpha-mannosidase DCW1 [Neonectria ditissima]|uniref:Mannan endo-1,6-alpha-mannosidase n=1 Tax=Neonectria ditissima TaxID=78410 RepID=A0A0P7ASJ1_9HYPO|nr:Mannan endo-1,6-alpha-mannosidase DCW1 [Neonectria ditissima]
MKSPLQSFTTGLSLTTVVNAIDVSWDDDKSVKSAASTIAYGLVKYYTGNNTGDTPGNLPDPYYWWEAGGMFGTLIDYWWLTGDESYNEITTQAMLHQVGEDVDYVPRNQSLTEGNDDQGFWAMAAMSAAENKYPDPPEGQPQWLALVQAVFNEYVSRWDTKHCGGGMRWQIFTWNNGYDYKNSISNGCFFNIAARLARYTGNETYSNWAEKIWEWETKIGLISDKHEIFDGIHFTDDKCPSTNDSTQWSYNTGIFLYGAAAMYNLTESDTWKTRVDDMMEDITNKFIKKDVIYEQFCEMSKQCDQDQQSFKGYLARWLAATALVAPYTYKTLSEILLSSAKKAATACSGSPTTGFSGVGGTACGFSWVDGTFDGLIGVGPQMSALQIVMYTLAKQASAPVTDKTGGTSKGDPSGGKINDGSDDEKFGHAKPTMADKVGAGILTCVVIASYVGGMAFVLN